MPLNDPVGSNAVDVLLRNASDLDKIVSSSEYSVTTRTGANDRTISGINKDASDQIARIGFEQPTAYSTGGQTLLRVTQTVTNGGFIYAPAYGTTFPFITSGAFNSTLWRVISTVDAGVVIGLTQATDISALRVFSPSFNKQQVSTASYSAGVNGGGNSFYWDSSSVEPDNKGTVIKPTATSGAGRFLAARESEYSPTLFGCVIGSDCTTQFQEMLNSICIADSNVVIDMKGENFSITTVNIPLNCKVKFQNGGIVSLSAGMGLSRTSTVSPQSGGLSAKYPVIFDNVKFTRATSGGSCAYIKLAWQDSTAGFIFSPSCTFDLTNGAWGINLGRSFFNDINGSFTMDASSTGVMCDSTDLDVTKPANPFETSFNECNFTGGTAFDQVMNPASGWNSFEGFSFGPSVRLYASKFKAKKYNTLKIIGSHLVNSQSVLDSGTTTILSGGYADRNTADQGPIFTFLTTVRDHQQIFIGGGFQIAAQGSAGDGILFSDNGSGAGKQITNVTLGDILFVGGLNDAGNQINGVNFSHGSCRNVNGNGGQQFQNMYSCFKFTKPINRSKIDKFVARDISFYSIGANVNYSTSYNSLCTYAEVAVELMVPNYIQNIANEVVYKQMLECSGMQRPPTGSVTNIDSFFGAGFFTITATGAGAYAIPVSLIKNSTAPGSNRGGCNGTVVLDAQSYIAPL
jgi:hypothetical protein